MKISELNKSDIGCWVEYWPKQEIGRIKSWNEKWIFVVYNCDNDWDDFKNFTAAATDPKELQEILESDIRVKDKLES